MAIFQSPKKYFSEAEISRKIPVIPQKEQFSPNFRLRNLKIQSPKKCNSTRLPPDVCSVLCHSAVSPTNRFINSPPLVDSVFCGETEKSTTNREPTWGSKTGSGPRDESANF